MKNILFLMLSVLMCIVANSTYAQIGGFNANTNYATNSRMIRYTNRLFQKQYTAMPSSSSSATPGFVTGSYLATYGASSICTPSCTSHAHKGLDQGVGGSTNVSIYAPISGVVTGIGGNTGKICIYNSYYNFTFIVLHCSSIGVSTGSNVSAGTYIGKSGSTSPNTIAVHVHTEICPGNVNTASCPCPTGTTYDPCIIADLFTPTYSANPSIGNFTTCPSSSISASCGTFLGSSVLKAKVTSISGGFIYFSLQKCSGTFNSSGTGYLKISDVCGSVIHSVAYSAGQSSMNFSAPLLHSSGSVTYYLTVTSSTGDRYYASPITVTASMASFPSITDENEIDMTRLSHNSDDVNDVGCQGNDLQNMYQMECYPNPASGGVFLLKIIGKQAATGTIKVIDIAGKEVLQKELTLQEGENNISLMKEPLGVGTYIIAWETPAETQTMKLIVD